MVEQNRCIKGGGRLQASLRAKASASEAAHDASRQLKEKLAVREQELAEAHKEVQELSAAQARIACELTQLLELDSVEDANSCASGCNKAGQVDFKKVIQQFKAQQLRMWRDVQRLQKVCFTTSEFAYLLLVQLLACHGAVEHLTHMSYEAAR